MNNRVTNNMLSPIVLDSGTVMAASGTAGSVRDNVSLSEGDRRRYVDRGLLTVTAAPEESEAVVKEPLATKAGDSGNKAVSQIAEKRKEKD